MQRYTGTNQQEEINGHVLRSRDRSSILVGHLFLNLFEKIVVYVRASTGRIKSQIKYSDKHAER